MTTKPLARQEQGPVDELVGESWLQGEEGATTSHSSPSRDRRAPKAEPEEDLDVPEPEAQVSTLQDNRELSIIEIIEAAKMDSRESAVTSRCSPGESEEVVTELERVSQRRSSQLQTGEEPGELVEPGEDASPPPLSALHCETEAFSSPDEEVGEWISDVEVISDHTEDLTSPDSQCIQEQINTQLTETVSLREAPMCEKSTADLTTAEGNVTELSIQPDGIGVSQTENDVSKPAHHFPSDSNNSDDVNIVGSPPFADESEEEEELICIMRCQNQLKTINTCNEDLLHACSDGVSVAQSQELSSALPASPSAKQQEEPLLQSDCEFTPRGEKQETAQQVLGQGSPPLSTVAMEPSIEGGAASHGSGCVVAVRERHGRAGERTEGENEQTGGEEGQKDDKLGGEETAGQRHSEQLLRDSQTAPTQQLRQEKPACGEPVRHRRHARMEKDSWDENQSDSGVSADFSPYSTVEGTQPDVSTETPIEREIRRSVERENSLRRSRGLPNPSSTPEYVEIPLRKAVFTQAQTGKSERDPDKDRELAGKMMQHDIQEETQREQDLVRLGKVPGVYDKGTVRQMKERRHIFEAFQAPTESPIISSARSKTPSWSSASDVSNMETPENSASQTSIIGGSYLERKHGPTQSASSAKGGVLTNSKSRGPGFSEGTGIQVVILENDLSVPAQKCYNAKPEANAATVVDSGKPHMSSFTEKEEEEEDDEMTPKENPFFKLRSSSSLVKVQQDIQETHAREKELRKQRKSLYGSSGRTKGEGGGGSVTSVEEKGLPSSSPVNGVRDFPESSSGGGAGLYAAHQPAGRFCVKPPTRAEDEKLIQPEVLQRPWSPRQKTPLVQRWESGLINGHNEEDD